LRRDGDASGDADLQMAISTCVLEHLLEYHFDLIFPKMEQLIRAQPVFARVFLSCWDYGQSKEPENARKLQSLRGELKHR
jgi:hypothetical protein